MFKIIKISTLTLFSLLLCFLTYRLCYLVTEKHLFDKLFYQKSVAHGYGLYYNPKLKLENFGNRAKDLIILESNYQPILDVTDNSKFKIAIIGDSFVWGQEIINQQRFAEILSNQLNKIKSTKVISLGRPGWNILDYLRTYQQIKNLYSPDLIIFSLVTNDILINQLGIGNSTDLITHCLQLNPNSSVVYDTDLNNTSQNNFPDNKLETLYQILTKAWSNPTNQCILDSSLKILPSDNAIYFIAEGYDNWDQTRSFKQYLLNNYKYTLSSDIGKNMAKYRKNWENDPWKNFIISTTEGHPNALANQMYADILFNEITTNPKWRFTK